MAEASNLARKKGCFIIKHSTLYLKARGNFLEKLRTTGITVYFEFARIYCKQRFSYTLCTDLLDLL